jgi:hypothetical protein
MTGERPQTAQLGACPPSTGDGAGADAMSVPFDDVLGLHPYDESFLSPMTHLVAAALMAERR